MLTQIGDFVFEINGTNFEKFKEKTSYKFSSQKRLGNFDSWQSVGKYEGKIDIAGTLIAKSQSQLRGFEIMAKKKEPQTMAFSNGTAKTVLILELETDKSSFLNDGAFLRQTYKINLVVVGDGAVT